MVTNVETNQERIKINFPDWALPFLNKECKKRYKVLYGGRGSGKSWQVAIALLVRATQEKLRIECFREIQNSIKDSVYRLLKDLILKYGLPGFVILQDEIRCINGSNFIFKGLRDIKASKNIKSLEGLDIAWIEEADTVNEESWEILIPTIRKKESEIWVTFNPRLETDYVWQKFVVLEDTKNMYVKKVNLDQNPDQEAIAVITQESELMQKDNPDKWRHIYGGEPVRAIEGAVYEAEIDVLYSENRVKPIEIEPNSPIHTACDLGYGDYTVFLLIQRIQHEIRILHCVEVNRTPLEEIIRILESWRLSHKIMPKWGIDILPHDSRHKTLNAPTSIFERLKREFNRKPICLKQAKDLESEISLVRSEWRNIWVNDTPECQQFLEHMKRYRYVIGSTGEKKPRHDEHSHSADALRYAVVGKREFRDDGENPNWRLPNFATRYDN